MTLGNTKSHIIKVNEKIIYTGSDKTKAERLYVAHEVLGYPLQWIIDGKVYSELEV